MPSIKVGDIFAKGNKNSLIGNVVAAAFFNGQNPFIFKALQGRPKRKPLDSKVFAEISFTGKAISWSCLLYTSDAADDMQV